MKNHEILNCAFCIAFGRKNLATRMLQIHMNCRHGLVVQLLQVIFYQPRCFAKMMAGNYMGDFVGFRIVWKIQPCSSKTPPFIHGGDYGASFSRTNTPGEID